jgi:glucose/arabinose dehydrogenase
MLGLFAYISISKGGINNISEKEVRIKDPALKLELVAQGLDYPTSMAFLGPNDILVLENQKSTVQRIENGVMLARPLLTVNVTKDVDKCMCGIAINNYNSSSKYVFIYFTEADGKKPPGDRLYRYQWINGSLLNPKLLIDIPATANHPERHAGGAILIDPNNRTILYLTTGDDNGLHRTLAQNEINGRPVDDTSGILRMTVDGKPTQPNGILGNSYPLNLYYAYGIRNSYGLDIDPITGNLWDTENGPAYGDEINLVEPGFNSGSDKIQGFALSNYSLHNLVNFGGKGKYSDPELEWGNSLGPTALKFLRSDKLGRDYQNDLFVADVIYGRIYHFDLNDARRELILKGPLADKKSDTDKEEELQDIILATIKGGVTDLKVSPYDGYLYLVAYGQGKIFRIVPSN